jgi:hypothetical protein
LLERSHQNNNKKRSKIMTIRTDIDNKIAELNAELAKAQAKAEAFDILTPPQRLATELHNKLCHSNHTDGCTWFYREQDWTEFGHKKYLEKAENILEATDLPTALKIIEFI